MEATLNTFADLIGTFLPAFGSAMISVWQTVVTFLMKSGNEIALIGVFAFLFVMGVGGIRKLITGV